MQKQTLLSRHIATIILVCALTGVYGQQVADVNISFFHKRTIYLDNLISPAAFWANPAILALETESSFSIANVSPMGGIYTLAAIRGSFVLDSTGVAGIGFSGTDEYESGSFSADNSSATWQSNFIFSTPSVQVIFARPLPLIGLAGVIASLGTEQWYTSTQQFAYSPTVCIGAGWFSPAFKNALRVSLATYSTGHFYLSQQWEHDAKFGLRLSLFEEAVRGSFEYTWSFGKEPVFFSPAAQGRYEAFKGNVSLRFWGALGLLAGVSRDLDIFTSNKTMIHGGLEYRQTDLTPYWGGYEIGINDRRGIIHRIWIGYSFGKKAL